MAYPLIPRHFRPAAPRRRPEPKPAAAIGMMVEGEGFHDMPLGGYDGEMLQSPPPGPPPAPSTQLKVEPPEWADQLESGNLDPALLGPLDPPPQKMDALAELKQQQEPEYDPPAPAGPPIKLQPLVRPRPPEPDWRAEERLSAEGNGELRFHEFEKDAP